MSVADLERQQSIKTSKADRPAAKVTASRVILMRWLVGLAIFFAIAGIAVALLRELTGHLVAYGLIPLFDLDGEESLSAVFTAALMLVSAFLAYAAGRSALTDGSGFQGHWRVLALGFVVMSVDELSGLHELLDRPIAWLTGAEGGLLEFAWVLPAALFAVGVLVAYTPFLLKLPRATAVRFVVAGGVYVGAAVGLDAVTGWIVDAQGQDTVAYVVAASCEEILEMVGLLIFIDACLVYLASRGATLDLRLSFRRS